MVDSPYSGTAIRAGQKIHAGGAAALRARGGRIVTVTPPRGPDDTRQAYDLLRTHKVDPEPLVTHTFDLADVQQAYATAAEGGAALKVLVTFPRGPR